MKASPSELSHRITLLKGSRTSAEIAKGAKVSRETFRKIERGISVKLSTIRKICDFLKCPDDRWHEIVVAWVKGEIGSKESSKIRFSYANRDQSTDAESTEISSLAQQLSEFERQQIIYAMTRPEVRRSLAALNNLYDTVKRR